MPTDLHEYGDTDMPEWQKQLVAELSSKVLVAMHDLLKTFNAKIEIEGEADPLDYFDVAISGVTTALGTGLCQVAAQVWAQTPGALSSGQLDDKIDQALAVFLPRLGTVIYDQVDQMVEAMGPSPLPGSNPPSAEPPL
jgi:hypothetical protein